jgi:hypothetical protein
VGLFQQPSYPQVTTQQQTQTQAPQLSPAQQRLMDVSANFLTGQVGQPSQAYPGPMVAPLTPAQQQQVEQGVQLGQESYVPQQQGLGALGAYSAGAYLPTALGQTGAGTLGRYAGGAYLNDPFLNAQMQAITNQAAQQFAASVPQLRAPFVAAGQTGFSSPELSALYGAGAQAATGLQANLMNTLGPIYLQEQQNQLNAANQALAAYQAAQGMQLQAAPQAVQAGGAVQTMGQNLAALPQQVQQAQYAAAMQDWLRQLSGAWAATGVPAFGEIATGGAPTTTTVSGTTTAPPLYGPSPFQSILGGLGQFAGPAAYFFRR